MARAGQTGHPPPEDGSPPGGPPPPPPPDTSGGLTDDQIKAMFPWVPWAQLANGGKDVCAAIRNATAAGGNAPAIANAAWGAVRSDPNFDAIVPGFNTWATGTGHDPSDYSSLGAFNSDKAEAAFNIDSMPQAWRDIFSPSQLAALRSGNKWADPDLFGFANWAQQNLHYYTDPQFAQYHGKPDYNTLHSAYAQGIQGSDLQYGWSVQAQNAANAASEARADARSSANQAASDAKQEADRKARIETAATRIQQGYDPAVASMFTPEELHNAAVWDAGGEWGDGKASKLIALASPSMQLFRQYYGRDITRAELDQYYASGVTPEILNHQLGGAAKAAGVKEAFNPALSGMFTPEEIDAYAKWQAGLTENNPTGEKISQLIDLAGPVNNLYLSYYQRAVTRQELDQAFAQGQTPETINQHLNALGFQTANQSDIQYYTGAFGEGAYTPDQVMQLGLQNAGATTQFGQALQSKFDQAVQRARTSFSGQLAHIERSNRFANPTAPDVAA